MVFRVYVEKKPGLAGEAESLKTDLQTLLGISSLEELRLFTRSATSSVHAQSRHQCMIAT